MSLSIRLLATSLAALALAGGCQTQPSKPPTAADVSYCQNLAGLYKRYVIGTSGTGKVGTPDISTEEAVVQCPTNPASSIPVLERTLTGQQITLPPRN